MENETKGEIQSQRRAFAHGTSSEHVEDIVHTGLNEQLAREASKGGLGNRPGHFFTHEIGPPGNPGLGIQAAYEWGLRHTDAPVVLIGQVPTSVVEALEERGYVVTETALGGEIYPDFPPQTVFSPQAYPILNRHTTWQILKP